MDSEPYLSGPHLVRDVLVEKVRTLPLGGEILVAEGDVVEPETVVAHLNPEGYLHFVNVAKELDIPHNLAGECVLKAEGESVRRGEVIATRPAALGLLLAECRSPTDGVIEKIYPSGHLAIRGYPVPVQAFVGGRVVETVQGDRVAILTAGTLLQGVYGFGGEAHGPLAILDSDGLPRTAGGATVVTPAPASRAFLNACLQAKVAAIVAPSAHLRDLEGFASEALAGEGLTTGGSAAAGPARPTVILMEGFGEIPMSPLIYESLRSLDGRQASVSGFTQLRPGVERPEIIVPHGGIPAARPPDPAFVRLGRRTLVYVTRGYRLPALKPGLGVRVVRAPHFGLEGEVVGLPDAPQRIPTGATLPTAVVRLKDGREVTVLRCNLEVIEGRGVAADDG